MEKQRHVVMYGRTVILGTVEASLKRFPGLEISVLSPPFPALDELKAMGPNVIIFDADEPRPEAAFALLETCPGLLMIGVDPCSEDVLFVSSYPARALTANELVQLMLEEPHRQDERG